MHRDVGQMWALQQCRSGILAKAALYLRWLEEKLRLLLVLRVRANLDHLGLRHPEKMLQHLLEKILLSNCIASFSLLRFYVVDLNASVYVIREFRGWFKVSVHYTHIECMTSNMCCFGSYEVLWSIEHIITQAHMSSKLLLFEACFLRSFQPPVTGIPSQALYRHICQYFLSPLYFRNLKIKFHILSWLRKPISSILHALYINEERPWVSMRVQHTWSHHGDGTIIWASLGPGSLWGKGLLMW